MNEQPFIDTFPDERFSPSIISADVDCFVCGKYVSVLKSLKVECNVGPMGHVHVSCSGSMTPQQLFALYHKNILGAVKNHSGR